MNLELLMETMFFVVVVLSHVAPFRNRAVREVCVRRV